MTEPSMQADMSRIDFGERQFPAENGKVTSSDGTVIAYEKSGEGPPVVVLGGGLNALMMLTPIVEHLSHDFTVYNYDRRGRGLSGDGDLDQYTIDLEIEDLKAVIAAAGEPGEVSVFANCTGGMYALPAAIQGVPMKRLAMYEPPYAGPRVSATYMERMRNMIANNERTGIVSLFYEESVGFPDEMIEQLKQHPFWAIFEAIAPSAYYDSFVAQYHGDIPFDALRGLTVPTLVMDGGDSPQWMRTACEQIAAAIPNSLHHRADGEGHILNQKTSGEQVTPFFKQS